MLRGAGTTPPLDGGGLTNADLDRQIEEAQLVHQMQLTALTAAKAARKKAETEAQLVQTAAQVARKKAGLELELQRGKLETVATVVGGLAVLFAGGWYAWHAWNYTTPAKVYRCKRALRHGLIPWTRKKYWDVRRPDLERKLLSSPGMHMVVAPSGTGMTALLQRLAQQGALGVHDPNPPWYVERLGIKRAAVGRDRTLKLPWHVKWLGVPPPRPGVYLNFRKKDDYPDLASATAQGVQPPGLPVSEADNLAEDIFWDIAKRLDYPIGSDGLLLVADVVVAKGFVSSFFTYRTPSIEDMGWTLRKAVEELTAEGRSPLILVDDAADLLRTDVFSRGGKEFWGALTEIVARGHEDARRGDAWPSVVLCSSGSLWFTRANAAILAGRSNVEVVRDAEPDQLQALVKTELKLDKDWLGSDEDEDVKTLYAKFGGNLWLWREACWEARHRNKQLVKAAKVVADKTKDRLHRELKSVFGNNVNEATKARARYLLQTVRDAKDGMVPLDTVLGEKDHVLETLCRLQLLTADPEVVRFHTPLAAEIAEEELAASAGSATASASAASEVATSSASTAYAAPTQVEQEQQQAVPTHTEGSAQLDQAKPSANMK